MKIPRKYTSLVFGAIMGVLMSFVMSLLITLYTVGVPSHFYGIWFSGFVIACAIGIPTALVMTEVVKRIVDRIVASE